MEGGVPDIIGVKPYQYTFYTIGTLNRPPGYRPLALTVFFHKDAREAQVVGAHP